MASRVGAFGKRPLGEEVDKQVSGAAVVNERVSVTSDMLNEAVEQTLELTDPQHAHSLRVLWSMDSDHEAARMYFADQVKQRTTVPFNQIVKFTMTLNEVLTQEQTNKVIEYAPEFSFNFRHTTNHDHGFFSARRKIDDQILMSQFPASARYISFGGSVIHAVNMTQERCVVVSPFDMDVKDPTRWALSRLALRQIAGDEKRSPRQREMAASILRGDGVYHLQERAQETTAKAKFGVANHVYDVPLSDWPDIMNRCDMQVLEGIMHFSDEFWEKDEFDLEYSGAHVEIDRKADEFRMRVGESVSIWYEHVWSDLMRYGANQIMHTKHGTYSYQICERRRDTIRYRIIRVDGTARPDSDQVYCLPDVPMAEVAGFKVGAAPRGANGSVRSMLARRTYLFPLALWERMLSYAKLEVERGGLSYEKMYNHYRTVVPRQSINAVHVSGGQSVPLDDVPALIVHAAMVAHADVLLVQRTIRARTDQVQYERSMQDETTLVKLMRTFWEGIVAVGYLPLSPLSGVSEALGRAYLTVVRDTLVMWRPQVRVRSLNMAVFLDTKALSYQVRNPTQIDFRQYASGDVVSDVVDVARVDADTASGLLRLCGASLPAKYVDRLTDISGSTTVVGDAVSKPQDEVGVTWFKKGIKRVRRTVKPPVDPAILIRERRMAIQEAIHESQTETAALTSLCHRVFREVVVGGKPNEHLMHARKEEMYNPDLWRVRDGLLIDSVLNAGQGVDFTYSGVYIPVADAQGAYIIPVYEDKYRGPSSSDGRSVDRVHIRLPVAYTGYALVVDGLKIFNGPAIVDTMQRALKFGDEAYMYRVICHQGPPGCGKTTAVEQDSDPSQDTYLVPTRIAMLRLRDKLLDAHSVTRHRVETACRTLDSLLANYHRLSAEAKQLVTRLFLDEYVLAPSGKWHAAAVLLGVSELHAYGDDNQIDHKVRVEVSQLYKRLVPQVLEEEFLTFRCAPKILAMFNFVYRNEIRSVNNIDATILWVSNVSEVQWMANSRALTMYQADKKVLHGMLAHVKPKPQISTTHEAQGDDCDQVVLFNFETRKRGPEDTHYLYWLQEYALVALSRCRTSFYYVKQSRDEDMVTKMIANAADMYAVQKCADVESQGESY